MRYWQLGIAQAAQPEGELGEVDFAVDGTEGELGGAHFVGAGPEGGW